MATLARQLPAHLTLRRALGEGGSSVVYEAFHARLKVAVAVKILAVRGELADSARQRMLREAELYALLDDPRIPRVYDVDELPDGTPYVVMEMVPGKSLELLLAESRTLPVALALDITREVLLALRAVHARGVLHRDIKPANVILAFDDAGSCQVRLVDFGIAKVASLSGPELALTQRGALVGTPQYMAPERLTGQAADLTSEIYAVGVMLYEMLAGRVPFGGRNLGAIMASVLRDPPTPLHDLRADLPLALDGLVMRAIARDPRQRFATADAMLEALGMVQAELQAGDHVHQSSVRRRPLQMGRDDDRRFASARPVSNKKPRVGALALAAALVLGAGYIVFTQLRPVHTEPQATQATHEAGAPAASPQSAPRRDLPEAARSQPAPHTDRAPSQPLQPVPPPAQAAPRESQAVPAVPPSRAPEDAASARKEARPKPARRRNTRAEERGLPAPRATPSAAELPDNPY